MDRTSRAQRFLLDLVEQYRRESRSRLPTYATLARMAGLSTVSIWKGVRALKQLGVLRTRQGGWVELRTDQGRGGAADQLTDPAATVAAGPKWQRVAHRMDMDIVSGAFERGDPLPSAKLLRARYRVGFRTIAKALRLLERTGRLSAGSKGSSTVRAYAPIRSTGTVLLVGAADDSGVLITHTYRTEVLVRTLESECARLRLGFGVLPVDGSGKLHLPAAWGRLFSGPDLQRSVLGYVFVHTGMGDQVVAEIHHQLASTGKPIALLDESGGPVPAHNPSAVAITKRFAMSYPSSCGLHVGRYLVELGHRRIAYVSPVHKALWSRNRLAGLSDAIGKAGAGAQVTPLVLTEYEQHFELVNARGLRTTSAAGSRGRARPKDAIDFAQWQRALEAVPRSDHRHRALLAALLAERERQALCVSMRPLLLSLVKCNDITAWVGANDVITLAGIEVLQQMGSRPPRARSVVGFDNSYDASRYGLSSYDFNCIAVAKAMLEHVLNPRIRRVPETQPAEIEGFVVERQGVSRVRSRSEVPTQR